MSNVITLGQLAQDFDRLFTRRVFRLETLNYYDAENEREPYARFLAGEPVDPAWREPWKARVRAIRESGRIMERVQVVAAVLGDYQRFSLLHGKPASVEAGEDVRVVSQVRAVNGGLGGPGDFWMFDDDLVAVLHYDGAGRAEHVEMVTEPFLVAYFGNTRDLALSIATPLAKYVAEHNITERKTAA